MSERRGDWMQTYCGQMFWPMDPRADEVDIRDIAHALSNACRYAGHVREFYSVAEHSVLMSRAMSSLNDRRWALLHDATEAYLVDVPRPVKPYLAGYREAEAALMDVIATRFRLVGEMPETVKRADNGILQDERAQAMGPSAHDCGFEAPPLGVTLRFWRPDEAEREFLISFSELWPDWAWGCAGLPW